MLQTTQDTTRVWVSRVFAVWLILAVMLSPSPFRAVPLTERSALDVAASISAVRTTTPKKQARKPVPRPSNTVVCLAQTLFFEAANEPFEGLQAVAATVFNRVGMPGYSSSVCGVIYQPYQYSWTLDTDNWRRRPPAIYIDLAQAFLHDRAELEVEYPVTHFHRVDTHPAWEKTLEFVIIIGQHKFYRG